MVKRLRRRPLTAESGVRFPMRVPKETGTAMCLFFCLFGMGNLRPSATSLNTATKVDRHCNVPVFCLFGMGNCAQAQLPSTRYQKEQALQCACFLFIRHGEFAPKRNFPQHGTKRNRHCNVPVFVYSAWGICAQAQLPSTRYQKKQALQCACFLFIRHVEFAPKRNFLQHDTKRNRHCNVPVFLFIRHGEFAPKRNFSQHSTKRNRHCNVPVFLLQ